jgi:pectate lyase
MLTPLWILIGLLLLVATPAAAGHAPVEGWGAVTQGGTGKTQCMVTTLADRGTGSLRACVTGGNRDVRFAVGGTIALILPLILGSSTTIDGSSAPAPGITLTADTLRIWDASDIIVRDIRIRSVGFTGTLGTTGTVQREIDCIDVQGNSQRIVFDHVSVYNCGDGGIDIKAPARDVTIQWSILSTWKQALWGATDTSVGQTNILNVSAHHNAFVCNDRPNGCDRNPLIRASFSAVDVDLRANVFEGWARANGTKIEPAARVNVVENVYLPRADLTASQRRGSLKVGAGTQVHTSGNVELGPSPPPRLNANGNVAQPFPFPAITVNGACGAAQAVVANAGARPRDVVDQALLAFVSPRLASCRDGGGGGGGRSRLGPVSMVSPAKTSNRGNDHGHGVGRGPVGPDAHERQYHGQFRRSPRPILPSAPPSADQSIVLS